MSVVHSKNLLCFQFSVAWNVSMENLGFTGSVVQFRRGLQRGEDGPQQGLAKGHPQPQLLLGWHILFHPRHSRTNIFVAFFVSFSWFILEIWSIKKKIDKKNSFEANQRYSNFNRNECLVDCWQQIIYSLNLALLCFLVTSKQMMTIKSRNVYASHMQINKSVILCG